MTDWFVARLPRPMRDDPRSQPWIEIHEESAALLELLERIPTERIPELLHAGDEFAFYNGPFPGWIGVCDKLAGVETPQRDQSVKLRVLSWVCQQGGEMSRALAAAEEKLSLDEGRNDSRETGEAHTAMADVHTSQCRFDKALDCLRNGAMPAYCQTDYQQGIAETHGRIADVLQARGDLDEALRIRREEELPVFERLSDVRELLMCRRRLASELIERCGPGDRDEAAELLRQAHAAAEKMGIP